jgi:hypothetical protein
MTEHVSDLTWDRLHAGSLGPALVDQVRQHVAACSPCAERGAALEATHRRFVAAPPPLRASRVGAWRVMGPAFAVAAAALVFVLARGEREATRTKGGFAVTVFAGRGGDAVPLGAGDAIFPGDRLQLSYSAPRDGHLAVLAIDGAEHVEAYFPSGETTWPAAAGHQIALPASTELDDVLGDERLWIVFCDRPRQLASLIAVLAERGAQAEPPRGCEVQRLQFDKRSRGGAR